MSTLSQPKFPNARLLKRTSLFAALTIVTFASLMTASVQAQTKKANKLADKATVTAVKQSQVVKNGAAVDVSAICPNNTIAIGGGGEVSPNGLANAYLTANSPILSGSTTPTGWHIIGSNLSGGDLTFSAYAICAQLSNSR
jgi:hypothetical protein